MSLVELSQIDRLKEAIEKEDPEFVGSVLDSSFGLRADGTIDPEIWIKAGEWLEKIVATRKLKREADDHRGNVFDDDQFEVG